MSKSSVGPTRSVKIITTGDGLDINGTEGEKYDIALEEGDIQVVLLSQGVR